MDLKWLDDFLSLAQTRSFARSADERHVSQPAFGRRIRALEAWVGVPLVDRSGFPCALTREGELFRDTAQEVSRMLADARAQLSDGTGSRKRAVTLVTGKTLSITFFPSWFARVSGAAGADVRVVTTTMHDGTLQLVEGGADFLLCYCHPDIPVLIDPGAFEYQCVGLERLVPVTAVDRSGSPRHALPGSATDPVPLIYLSPTTTQGRMIDAFLERNAADVHVVRRIETDFSEMAALLASQGAGTSWIPQRVFENSARGTLARAGGDRFTIECEIRLYRRATNRAAPVEAIWRSSL